MEQRYCDDRMICMEPSVGQSRTGQLPMDFVRMNVDTSLGHVKFNTAESHD